MSIFRVDFYIAIKVISHRYSTHSGPNYHGLIKLDKVNYKKT